MQRWRLLPVAVGLVFSILSILLWRGLRGDERAEIQRGTALAAEDMASAVQARAGLRFSRLTRMARRWESWGPFTQSEWEMDAALAFEPESFRAIELLDAEGRVRWVVPGQGNEGEAGRELAQDPGYKELLGAVATRREPQTGPLFPVAQGQQVFRFLAPCYREGKLEAYLAGILSLPGLMETVTEGVAREYHVTVYHGNQPVYAREMTDLEAREEWGQRREVDLGGLKLRLEVWPSEELRAQQMGSWVPDLTLGMGLGLSWLLALAVLLGQRARARAERLAKEVHVRELAEEALEMSQSRYRVVTETASDAIISITADSRIVFANAAVEKVFGYTPAELRGKELTLLMPEYLRELHRAAIRRYVETGKRHLNWESIELTGLHKDGREIPVEVSFGELVKEGRHIFTGIVRDISERKRAEEALRVSEERYRLLFDKNPHSMWVFDQHTLTFLAVNDAAVKQYGYAREEFLGMTIKDIRPAGEVQRLEAHLSKPQAPAAAGSAGVWRHRKKDGSEIDVEVTSEALMFGDREAKLVLAVDVTEKRQGEEALRKSEKMLAEAQRVAQLGSWEWDMVANQLYWSEETYRILGVTPEEMGNRMELVLEVVHPEDRERVKAALAEAAAHKKPFASEHRVVRPDGAVRVVKAQAEASYDGEGRALRMVGIVHDITEQRRLEEQFQQAQKMEAVGRLAGGIAHDFNNLLMLIRGYSELMQEHAGADETEKQYAREVIEAADRAAGLTQQLLAFSRRQVLEPKVVSVNETVEQMEKMLRRVLGEDIELGVRRKSRRPWVKVDPTQLEQVILNLAVNSRDAMPKGGLLTLETADAELDEEYARGRPEVQPGDYVMLAMSDTGAGMTEEVRAHAFDPFFTTKEKGKGTGLGLATVYGIVKQSGGNIWVYSEPGKGTTFKIYFPLVRPPVEEEAVPKAAATPNGTGTVLLVEDEERVRKLGRQFLESSGYRVLEATTVSEALELMAKHKDMIDVLMTDVVMPQMSGRELAERVVKMKPGLRVLFMSGYTDDVIVRHGELEAGRAFLQKPFTKEALARKLRELLGG